jgi:hypothetical protein
MRGDRLNESLDSHEIGSTQRPFPSVRRLTAYGDHRYGDRKTLAATGVFGLAFETLMDYGTVARSVKTSNRFEVLSFTHHLQVAALRPARQKRFLTRALENGWSVSELKRQIAADGRGDRDPGPRSNEETAHKLGGKILEALRALPELEWPNRKYLEDEAGCNSSGK